MSPRLAVLPALVALTACPNLVEGEAASITAGLSSTSTTTDGETTTTTTTTTSMTAGETTGETTGTPGDPPIPGPLRAGVAVGYLEGPIGVSMAGYGLRAVNFNTAWNDQLNGARGFHGLPSIKAMVLEVGDERLVLLKLPTMSSEASLTDGIADKLEALYGVDLRGRLLTGATHSHHTQARYWRLPDALGLVGADSPDEEIIDRMTTASAATVKAALDDLGPALWAYGAADPWDPEDRIYRDRRGENDPTYGKDPRLTMLAVRRPEGLPLATIFNFGIHGTVFGPTNELLTEDAAGGLEMVFEEAFFAAHGQPILGMFIQSGGGDAAPAGDDLGHRPPQQIELLGQRAAPTLLGLYDALEWRDEAALRVRSQRIDLTYETFGYDRIGEFVGPGGFPYTWGAWQCMGEGNLEGKPKSCQDVGALLMALGEAVPHGEIHQVYLSAAILDELALVTIPGEPTYSMIRYLRESLAAHGLETLALGYSQDHLLYLSHPDDWFQGGYETEMSLWGPFAGRTLVDRQVDLVGDLMAGVAGPVFSEESPNLSPPQAFTPRALEVSSKPPQALEDPSKSVTRLDTVYFAWAGGDPNIDSPHAVVHRREGDAFAAVPSPSGRPGDALDNRRYAMITSYEPDPPPKGDLADTRLHGWRVAWELPIDLPAGDYRLEIRGRAFDGEAVTDYTITSSEFTVTLSPDANAAASVDGDDLLRLVISHPGPPPETLPGTSWLSRGYRLHDPAVGPAGPLRLCAPLRVQFAVDGVDQGAPFDLECEPGSGVYLLDFAKTELAVGPGITLRYHLRDDRTPALSPPVTVAVP